MLYSITLSFLSSLFRDPSNKNLFLDSRNARVQDALLKGVIQCATASRKRSVERRTLATLICSVFNRRDAYAELQDAVSCIEQEKNNAHRDATASDSADDVPGDERALWCTVPIDNRLNLSLQVSKSDSGAFRRRYTAARRD